MDDRITSSSSDADADAADRDLFMRRAKESLQDPRVRGYFLTGLVTYPDVRDAFAGGKAFEQGIMGESYLRSSAFRGLIGPQRRRVGAVIAFIRGRGIAMSRVRDGGERWLEDTMEIVIYPNVVEAINEVLLEKNYKNLWVEPESEGLKKLQDPVFRVSTRSSGRLRELLSQMDGGSIALAGARGGGESTRELGFRPVGGGHVSGGPGLCVYVPTPAECMGEDTAALLSP